MRDTNSLQQPGHGQENRFFQRIAVGHAGPQQERRLCTV
jgi:hypothetical protein